MSSTAENQAQIDRLLAATREIINTRGIAGRAPEPRKAEPTPALSECLPERPAAANGPDAS
jgi:hypothetical protein